ncbi:ABC transporter permease [Agrobacterium tumefaciens]|uniref:ABC transporter permease n=1 Tax=Agrobacterium tumefaciens TaxID=358 RepID=UPI0015720DE1|nr:ABC transporter permease [Agrobacterium tumefaciens]NTE56429.1 ABC transporter permease [Agrobacterium tumefaciens]NTE74397.1 ABC transporter permease [Agrobacterium tumefaciens]
MSEQDVLSSIGKILRKPETGSLLGMIAVFCFFAVFGQANFLSAAGAASWLNVASTLGIVALPVALLMIAGELDISVGAVVPAGSMVFAILCGHFGYSVWIGFGGALLLGLTVGLVNGILVLKTSVPSLIVTLGTLFAVAGMTLSFSVALTGTTSVAVTPPDFIKLILGDYINGMFQVTIFWWIAISAMYAFLLHYSPVGNWILALGGDRISARNAGIPTDKITIFLFVASSVSSAFVGVSQAILFNSAQVSSGNSFIFNSIISVVVGGVLLTGGYGSVIGVVMGTITFAIVNQGIYFTSFDANLASLIIGVLMLFAVLMNNTFRRMALSYSSKKK